MKNEEIKNLANKYNRQLILPGFGMPAQRKLVDAKILVVGCGGLGAPVVQYLAAAGVGQLTLYDPDIIELSNLHRQVIHRMRDVNRSKAQRAAEAASDINPDILVEAKEEWISIYNARNVIAKHDLILDCTDGLPNKYLLNDACVLEGKPLVHGSVSMMEGRLLLVVPGSACLRCLFSSLPPEGTVPSCQEVGVLGPVCGVMGSIMAIEAIKLITGSWRASVNNYVLASFEQIPTMMGWDIERNAECLACGDNKLLSLIESNYIQPTCEI